MIVLLLEQPQPAFQIVVVREDLTTDLADRFVERGQHGLITLGIKDNQAVGSRQLIAQSGCCLLYTSRCV